MSKTYVLDASAVFDLLLNRAGASRVAQLLKAADRSAAPLLASAVNWGEVFYLSSLRHGEQSARETLADLSRLPIRVVPVDLAQAIKAGEIKALYGIPYVDCMAASLAALSQSTLVTADHDFEKLGRRFPILWLTRP
jgi:predicted nucleic acid-binding protein